MELSLDKRQLCDIQGRLFINSAEAGLDSKSFITDFMNSSTAAHLDDVYDRLQWAGEEYILEELKDEMNGLKKSDDIFSREALYWIGYLYRFWHYYTGEFSKEICRQANAETMLEAWPGFHTLDPKMAVDRLKEFHGSPAQ